MVDDGHRPASAETVAIQISDLNKAFGRTPVLRGLDLEVPWGQVLTVLGPNGSGKTTLIRTLATLSKADSGSVRIGGLDLSRSGKAIRRAIGVVMHDTLLYDDLTGRENLRFFTRLYGIENPETKVASVVERMGMTSRLDQKVGTLSHGMKKRFSIARALLHDPIILLMDEPESGLDQDALSMLDDVITDKSMPNRTVIMTTHNLDRGMALGDRVAILSNGRIVFHESLDEVAPDEVKSTYYQHTRTAD